MPKYFATVLVFVLLLSLPIEANANAEDPEQENQLLKDTLFTLLNPLIQEEIIQYYGYPKQYGLYDATLVDLKRKSEGGFNFRVTIQVTTFEAAHNPPYGVEAITFKIDPVSIETLNYTHKGDEEEKKLNQFYETVTSDIKQSFNLDLNSYTNYRFNQLQYKSQVEEEFKSLFEIAETIVTDIINPMIQPPYKNIIDPVTYVDGDKGYMLFKTTDGTNVIYELQKEDDTWKVVNKETKRGIKMKNDLLWYM